MSDPQAVLARTVRALVDAPSRESMFTALAGVLTEDIGAMGFAVYSANAALRTASLDFQWGPGTVDSAVLPGVFWTGLFGRVMEHSQPIFVEQLDTALVGRELEAAAELLRHGVNALALFPLVLGNRTRGVLSVRFRGVHEFTDVMRALLTDVALHISLAFRSDVPLLSRVGELERRADRLTALAHAQQQLTHITSEDRLPRAIAHAVCEVIPNSRCEVYAKTQDGLRRVFGIANGIEDATDTADAAGNADGSADTLNTSLLVADTFGTGVPRFAVHLSGGHVELCAVVRYGNRTSGLLRLLSTDPEAFDLQDLDLLSILARHAGTAVETSRLFTLQESQRQRAEGAAELARVALQAGNLAEGAARLLAVLDRFVPSIGKAIGVAKGRDGMIEYVATSGTLDVLQGYRPPSGSAMHGSTLHGRPVEIADLSAIAAPAVAEALPEEWGFLLPLSARDRPLGVLVTTAARTAPLSRRDRTTLERLSASLALALDALLLDDEERLAREREQLLATALTTIDHPIFILDRVGVRYANPAAAREYGWSQGELMEMKFEQLVVREQVAVDRRSHPPLPDQPIGERDSREPSGNVAHGAPPHTRADAADDAGADGSEALVRTTEHVHRRRDETEFPAAISVSPLSSHDGQVIGQVVSVRNVSADRRMAEQLRATEKMVALGELVGGVAHEINNPLTGISAFSEMLLEEALTDDQRESVQLIRQECARASGVIRDLLIFARTGERETGPVDVNQLIAQTLRLRAYPLRHAGVEVVLELDAAEPHVRGDLQKLQQVLVNVIGNAEYAMHGMSLRRLTMRSRVFDGMVKIEAIDTGMGMPPDVRRRMFEPFFTTKKEGVGTGLGLSVSFGIVQAHGGTIDVRSEPGVGTTISVNLPVAGS